MAAHIVKVRGHDRGRPTVNVEIMEEMRELRIHLEAMETNIRRDPEAGDVSEPEDEEKREEVARVQETSELRYFRSILGENLSFKPESAEKAPRYVNGLRMDIQEEISMISPRTMEEAYQCSLRVE